MMDKDLRQLSADVCLRCGVDLRTVARAGTGAWSSRECAKCGAEFLALLKQELDKLAPPRPH